MAFRHSPDYGIGNSLSLYVGSELPFMYLLNGTFPVAVSTFSALDLHSYIPLCAYGAVILGKCIELLQCAVRGT